MASTSALDTLIDLAADERDAAAVTLGQLRSDHQQTQEQLDALIEYRNEYRHRLQNAMAEGLSMARLDNYKRFLAALNDAIAQQREAVTASDQRVHEGKGQWQSRQKKLRSYDTLAERRQQAADIKERRRDQKINDEFASRAHAHGSR